MTFAARLKRIAEVLGLACFAVFALCGLLGFIRGAPIVAAYQVPGVAAQPEAPVAPNWVNSTVPLVMNYQGSLRDAEGHPLTGYYTVTLRIYEGAGDPLSAALWAETHSGVMAREGTFNLVLGNNVPLPATLFDLADRFIGVTVLPYEEMVPRQRLASVPYALHANGSVPIGTVLAWHKSLSGTPVLPDGWVECNGQTLNDSASPYNGQVIPNLNGQALFIRGGATSGVFQQDQLQAHKHVDSGHTHASHNTSHNRTPANTDYTADEYGDYFGAQTGTGYAVIGDPVTSTGGPVRYGSETRPVNMSMVWIMRVR